VFNKRVCEGHYRLRLFSRDIARQALPGQFVQVLTTETNEPLLPRPFSFLDAGDGGFEILYKVVGKGTGVLSEKKRGDKLRVMGPLGNGWPQNLFAGGLPDENRPAVLIGGGVGIPPLLHLCRYWRKKGSRRLSKGVRVFLGARNKRCLLCEAEFRKLGIKPVSATDDGSRGSRGTVTDALDEMMGRDPLLVSGNARFFACGPDPMLRAVSTLAEKYDLNCQISVEEPMACGFGACLGCAVKVKDGEEFRYAMACKEGPVFNAREIIWD